DIVALTNSKQIVWADADGFNNQEVINDIVDKFLKYYSVTLNNYPVQDAYYNNTAITQNVIKSGPLAGGN
ncbi:formylmethanofuran dehydrogenase subunit A, partial [Methanocella sp. CWC-04]|nr:formylmethanofuran dehydrogenase subunit A [Methanocella sp. CWC-04]